MTTFTADRAAASFPVAQAHTAGNLMVSHGTYEVTINPVDGDIYKMCKVPGGATIIGGFFYADDLDTGTEALDVDVGWAANGGSGTYDSASVAGLANLGTLSGDASAPNLATAVGLIYNLAGANFGNGDLPAFTEETTIQIEANTAAETFTAGAMTVVIFWIAD
jgi:hypothetical protein